MKSKYKFMVLTQESSSSTLNGGQIFLSHITRRLVLNTFRHEKQPYGSPYHREKTGK